MLEPFFSSPSNRRQVIRTCASIAATSVLNHFVHSQTVIADIASTGLPSGYFFVRLSLFPALQKDGGSVRLGINRISGTSPTGGYYPVIVNRESPNQFHALDSECTHASCVVGAYSSSLRASVCPCHGSRFGIDGSRISGQALDPLRSYPIQFDGTDTLTVEIPNLGFTISPTRVEVGNRSRILLSFPSTLGAEHEVFHRTTWQEPWSATRFALTAEGNADRVSIAGNDRVLKIYVDRIAETGFWVVTMKVRTI